MNTENRLKIAIQKSGRLSQDSVELLSQLGIKFNVREQRLIAHAENLPIDILRVRDDDIPGLVMAGICDLGIVGENVLEEVCLGLSNQQKSAQINVLKPLEFARCRLSLAWPEEYAMEPLQWLNGKRIATTYPNLLRRFLRDNDITAQIVNLNGSVEVAPRAGLADAICDLVQTGATLEANGLIETYSVYKSQAVLVQSPSLTDAAKLRLIERLMPRLQGVMSAKESKYIMLHAPLAALPDIQKLLPGCEQPTILPLVGTDARVALHAVSSENLFWETMEAIKALGASSILVLPIEKMME